MSVSLEASLSHTQGGACLLERPIAVKEFAPCDLLDQPVAALQKPSKFTNGLLLKFQNTRTVFRCPQLSHSVFYCFTLCFNFLQEVNSRSQLNMFKTFYLRLWSWLCHTGEWKFLCSRRAGSFNSYLGALVLSVMCKTSTFTSTYLLWMLRCNFENNCIKCFYDKLWSS